MPALSAGAYSRGRVRSKDGFYYLISSFLKVYPRVKGTLPWKINVEIAAHADRDEEDNSNALYPTALRWTKVEVFEVEDLSHHGNDDARIVSRLCVTPFVHTDSAQSSTLCALTTYNTEARNNSRVTIAMEMRNFFLFFCR